MTTVEPGETTPASASLHTFWTQTPQAICAALHCQTEGLSSEEAARRLALCGPNADADTKAEGPLRAILRRLIEPLSLILLAAGVVSLVAADAAGGTVIVAVLALSIGLDTAQEGHAVRAAEVLRRSVALKAEVRRDGAFREIDVAQVVPGDVLRVRAGDVIPADALVLAGVAFTAGEAALTGEPYPVEKFPGVVTATSPGEATNALFRGSIAQTGEVIALAVNTGKATVFGAAASALADPPKPTARGDRAPRGGWRPAENSLRRRPGGCEAAGGACRAERRQGSVRREHHRAQRRGACDPGPRHRRLPSPASERFVEPTTPEAARDAAPARRKTASRRLIRSRRSDPAFAARTGRTSPPAAQSRRPSCSD